MAETDRAKLRALLEEFRTGMLITRTLEGTLHARPMAVAKLEENDDLFFATNIESGKVLRRPAYAASQRARPMRTG